MFGKKRQQRRRLMATGRVFVVCALLALLASWNSGINLYYLIFGAIASFLVFSAIFSKRSLKNLTLEREAPQAVHRGESFGVLVRISNGRRVMPAMSLRIETVDAPGVSKGYCLSIPAGRVAQLRMTMTIDRRGVHRLPAVELVTSFPFGIIEARRRIEDSCEVVVYPRVLAARTAIMDQLRGTGELPRVSQGPGDEFFSLREYVPGDDLRFIAWRASARTGTLLVRELEKQTSRFVVFVFDARMRADVPDFLDRFEDAIEMIASLAVTLLNRQFKVSVVTSSTTLGEGEGTSHSLKVLDMLARLTPDREDAPDPFDVATSSEDHRRVSYLMVSPDPMQWGEVRAGGAIRVLNPKEVIHA